MKKSRPAVKLSAIVRAADLSGVLDAFFEETTTLGVRLYEARRKKLGRGSIVVETRYGRVGVKVSKLGDVVKNISPEYEDCRRIALQLGIPLKEVYEEAKRAAREMRGDAAVAHSNFLTSASLIHQALTLWVGFRYGWSGANSWSCAARRGAARARC
jgi:hypothetical protein